VTKRSENLGREAEPSILFTLTDATRCCIVHLELGKKKDDGAFDRGVLYRLAAEAQLDVRTVERALRLGVDSLRARVDRKRFLWAVERLGVKL
jgi:hypothetical protein